MLNDRERRTLARIERQLVESDPDLARLFAEAALRNGEGSGPTVMLAVGLALMVFGSMVTLVPIAVVGMLVSLTALYVAARRPGTGRASFA